MTTRDEAFLAHLEEHKRLLYKVACTYARSHSDRQDLLQEMAAQLWRSFPRYDEGQRFSTWMYRVALNVAISHFRAETRRSRVILPGEDELLEVAAPPSSALDDDLDLLRRLVEGLGEVDRALVVLYLDDHSYESIATILGISASNVGTRLTRIKERLRRDAAAS